MLSTALIYYTFQSKAQLLNKGIWLVEVGILIIVGWFLGLKMLELIHPLRVSTQSWKQRLIINLLMAALVIIAASIFITPISHSLIRWTGIHQIGLLHWFKLPLWCQMIVGFLLMDLTFYYWHRLNHALPILWRFHNVHHVDPDLDVSTSFRFHFVEIAYSSIFRIVQLTVIGINPVAYIAYEFVFQANTLFQHSNVKLPINVERLLNKILVTPRMHGIHHSQFKTETNANYSVVFCFWDRLHHTLRLNIPQQAIRIGVPAYQAPEDNRFFALMAMPFTKQRAYWQTGVSHMIKRDEFAKDDTALAE